MWLNERASHAFGKAFSWHVDDASDLAVNAIWMNFVFDDPGVTNNRELVFPPDPDNTNSEFIIAENKNCSIDEGLELAGRLGAGITTKPNLVPKGENNLRYENSALFGLEERPFPDDLMPDAPVLPENEALAIWIDWFSDSIMGYRDGSFVFHSYAICADGTGMILAGENLADYPHPMTCGKWNRGRTPRLGSTKSTSHTSLRV